MIVYCSSTNCTYNIAGECVKPAISINMVCMDKDITGSTGEIIEGDEE